MDKEEDSKAPPSPGKKSFLSDISGGVNNLKKRDTSPAPPKSSGNSMMDAIMAQKSKMAEKRATPSPQSVTPPPQKQNSGGFNTNMLQRAQMKTTAKEDSDSDGDGWSDDGQSEEKQVTKKVQEALKPTPKPTNSNLKATTVKPPEVVKAPPSRPKDLAAEKKLEESKKVAPPPPPPAEKTPEPEKKVLKESVAQAVKNETPPPPPPSDKTKSPLRSATPPPPASKASGNDKESEKTNAHVPSNEVEELKKRLEIAEKKLSEAGHSSSMLLREAVLEEQLERAHETIVTLKHDKNALKLSIKELQTRLTNAEVHKKNGGDDLKQQTASNVHEAMKRGEREKDLEKQLIKAKKDKDKALKLLIQLIGKERIAEHLQKHAGDGDILDSLIASFGGSCSAPRASNSTSPKKKKFLGSTASKGGSGTMGKPAMRSRSDQYFFENQY